MPRPNILLVITHDSGQHFGCYGAEVETPNVDRIAAEGVRFDAFCTAPQCSPARASLLTGLYPHRHGLIGLTHRGFRLDPNVKRLPGMLADAGYHTLLFGQHHEEPDPHAMGYRRVIASGGRGSDRTIRRVLPEAEAFLSSQPAQPFFACVGFSESHRPFDVSRHPMDNPDEVIVPAYLPDEPAVRTDVAELNGVIRGVDEAVGRIDAALSAAGLSDNTLLIYTTDHGIAFPCAKGTLFDPGIEVALVGRGPGGFAGGRAIRRLVGTMDLTPTLLEVAGAEVPPGLDGRSLLPLLAQGQRAGSSPTPVPWRDHLFAEQTYHAGYDPVRCVRTERYKYIRSFADRPVLFPPNVDEGPTKALLLAAGLHRQPRPAEQLYDLSADPTERTNLVDDPASQPALADLRAHVQAWMEQTNDPLLAAGPAGPDSPWHRPVPKPEGAVVTPAGSLTPEDLTSADDWRG